MFVPVESFAALAVWIVANVVYVDLVRRGSRGPKRLVSFFLGWPLTFVSLLTVKEGDARLLRAPPDDEERLLREIRIDRELRDDRIGR